MRKKNVVSTLDKIRAELAVAREKRDRYDERVKELEKKYSEQELAQISDIVHKAKISPEQLAEILIAAGVGIEQQEKIEQQDDIEKEEPYNEEV